jgi:phosphoglycerate dehydrogenase-like enzyme
VARPKVVIFRPVDERGDSHRRLESAGCEVVVRTLESSAVPQELAGADVLLGATFRGGIMDAAFLDAFRQLRLVAKYTIGYDDVDVVAASRRGILVTHSPTEANFAGVAEGTMAMILGLLKKLRERDAAVKRGQWRDPSLRGVFLGARDDGYAGVTIGIVGLGRIGTRLARLLAPWRARLIGCDPYVDDAVFASAGVERRDLQDLLEESDVVTLHCSLSDETRRLINAGTLALMKPSAILVNTARGSMVDTDALCSALEGGRLAGAALDVLPVEPPDADSPLLELGDRVLLWPHMSAANEGGTLDAAIPWATEATLAALRGEVPEHVVNREAIGAWKSRYAGRSLLD